MSALVREGTVRGAAAPVLDPRSRRRLGASMIAAFAAFVALLVLLPSRLEPEQPVPNSVGTGPEDFLAFLRTLEALELPAERLLSTYGNLPAASDHALVTLAPRPPSDEDGHAAVRLDAAQTRALRTWLESGGAWLLALPHGRGGSDDAPWEDAAETLPVPADADPVSIAAPLPPTAWVPARGTVEGRGALAGIRVRLAPRAHLAGEWPAALRRAENGPAHVRVFTAVPEGWEVLLELAGRPVAVSRRIAAGMLVLVSTPLPFQNLALGALGTGEIAVRLAYHVADGGRRMILMDEFAHGLGHDRGLWWIARRHGFGGLLVALAALLLVTGWRGAVRRAPSVELDTVSRRSTGELVVALADIARRAGRPGRAAERFLDGQELLARRRGDREALRKLADLRRRANGVRDPQSLRDLVRDVDRALAPRDITHPAPGANN